jgi:hypothetical protein
MSDVLDAILTDRRDDEVNWEIHQGRTIPVNTQQEIDDARRAMLRVYADVGHTAGADELNDLENRIRGGQSLAEIVANSYDDARRRFPAEGTNQSSTFSEPDQPDAQLNQGRRYEPTSVMMEQLITPAREVADLQDGWQLRSAQQSPMGNSPMGNYGPARSAIGGSTMMVDAGEESGFPWGLVLIGAAVLVGGYLLIRKRGK